MEKWFRTHGRGAVEILLLVVMFWLWGGWPVPDVNEQYYIGKAVHFWNPDWLPADRFLDTPDSHWFFYATLGVFSTLFSPGVLVWFGRFLIWTVTAWSWRKLSRTIFPYHWFSLLTAAAFLFFLDAFHLAGEWIIGGVEGKGFAFPFVFLGLAAFCNGKFGRTWIYFGIGSAFHVLVGGWAVIACLFAWLIDGLFRGVDLPENGMESGLETTSGPVLQITLQKRLRLLAGQFVRMLPWLLVGGLIALLGLIPALLLDGNATGEVARKAHQIYVFQRLSHHLVPSMLPWIFLTRFLLLTGIWVLLYFIGRKGWSRKMVRLQTVIFVSLLIAATGLLIDFGSLLSVRLGLFHDRLYAAELLRFYWFRLSDWTVPLGVTFASFFLLMESGRLLIKTLKTAKCYEPVAAVLTNENASEKVIQPKGNRIIGPLAELFLFWICPAAVFFFVFKVFFQSIAVRIAASATTDPNFPILPRPVEGISFLAALFSLGLVLFILQRVWKSNRAPKAVSACSTGRFFVLIMGGIVLLTAILSLGGPGLYLLERLDLRSSPVIPRSHPPKESISNGWLDICRYVRNHTGEDAVFLVPRGCDSFKWDAHRAEIGSWKEIPQDAASIVEWYSKMETFYTIPGEKGPDRWNQPLVMVLISKGLARVQEESQKYGVDYIITENPPYVIASHEKAMSRYKEFYEGSLVYQNDQFTLFRMKQQ